MGKYIFLLMVIIINSMAVFGYFMPEYKDNTTIDAMTASKLTFKEYATLSIEDAPAFLTLNDAEYKEEFTGYYHERSAYAGSSDHYMYAVPVVDKEWTSVNPVSVWLISEDYGSPDIATWKTTGMELAEKPYKWQPRQSDIVKAIEDAFSRHNISSVPLESAHLISLSYASKADWDFFTIFLYVFIFINFLMLLLLMRFFLIKQV